MGCVPSGARRGSSTEESLCTKNPAWCGLLTTLCSLYYGCCTGWLGLLCCQYCCCCCIWDLGVDESGSKAWSGWRLTGLQLRCCPQAEHYFNNIRYRWFTVTANNSAAWVCMPPVKLLPLLLCRLSILCCTGLCCVEARNEAKNEQRPSHRPTAWARYRATRSLSTTTLLSLRGNKLRNKEGITNSCSPPAKTTTASTQCCCLATTTSTRSIRTATIRQIENGRDAGRSGISATKGRIGGFYSLSLLLGSLQVSFEKVSERPAR